MEINPLKMNSLPTEAAAATGSPIAEVSKPPTPNSAETAMNAERVKRIIAEMLSQVERTNVSLEFTTYGNHGDKLAVIIADKVTGKVIREIPSRELQELYTTMDELSGMIFNRQV